MSAAEPCTENQCTWHKFTNKMSGEMLTPYAAWCCWNIATDEWKVDHWVSEVFVVVLFLISTPPLLI